MPAKTSADAVRAVTRNIVEAHISIEGPLLPILHAVQDAFGHVPQDALPEIADGLNISGAEVHGVMSFYHDFRKEPSGRHSLKICRAEACQSMGSEALASAAKAHLGIDWHGTTKDGQITLVPVFCLGLCACAPAVLADGKVVGRVDTQKLVAIIGEMKE